MAQKVHPRGDSPIHPEPSSNPAPVSQPTQKPLPPQQRSLVDSPNLRHLSTSRTVSSSGSSEASPRQRTVQPPPPGTYVVQLPKEQILSHPPPENEKKYQMLSMKKPRRSRCRACLCCTLGILLLLIIAIAIAAGVLYLVFRPTAPDYTVSEVAIRGVNLTSSSPMSPAFDIRIRAGNDNKKIGIYYQPGSQIRALYDDVLLGNGALPVFYQPPKNVTIFQTALEGSNVVLAAAVRSKLANQQRQGNVPFTLNVKAPVKIKVGAVKTWTITVTVKCDVSLDAININSRIISKNCNYGVKLW